MIRSRARGRCSGKIGRLSSGQFERSIRPIRAARLTRLEWISICSSHIPGNVNIRADVVIMFPLLLVAWLECIGLAILAALKKPRKTP